MILLLNWLVLKTRIIFKFTLSYVYLSINLFTIPTIDEIDYVKLNLVQKESIKVRREINI